VPDLPGFGENPPPEKPWSIDDYVNWVKNYIEKLSQTRGEPVEPFFLLGHSFGGSVAIKFSLKYPENIKKIFLVASAGIRRKTIKKGIMRKTTKFLRIFSFLPFYSLLRKVFYRIIIPKSDYPYAQGVMKETYLKVVDEDLSNYFSGISVSTVIIWGEKDDVFSIKNAYFMNREIKNSNLVIIPKADHDLERKVPEILAEKIIQFLEIRSPDIK